MFLLATLLLTLSSTRLLGFSQGQPAGYDLTFSRPVSDSIINRILLRCADTLDDTLIEDAKFFRNGVRYDLPRKEVVSGSGSSQSGVSFVVDRLSEGNFTCGVEGITSVPDQTIVGKLMISKIHCG